MSTLVNSITRIATLEPKCGRRMLWAILFTFMFKVFEALPDVLFGLMIDIAFHKNKSFLVRHDFPATLHSVYVLGGIILVVWLACSASQFLSTLHWKQAASAIQHRMRMDLCSHILNQSAMTPASDARDSLRSDHRMTNQDIDDVEFFVHRTLEDLFRLVFSTLIVGPILLVISPLFLVYALIPIVPTFFLARFLQRRVRPGYDAVKKSMKVMYRDIDELLSGFGVIKDFGMEDRFYQKVQKAAAHLDHESIRTSYLAAAMSPLIRTLVQFGVLAILVHAVVMVFHGQITFGEFAATSFLSRKFLLPLTFLGGVTDLCGKGVRSIRCVSDAIYKSSPLLAKNRAPIPEGIESIRINALSYSYDDRQIFANFDAEFRPGIMNVVKGPTGVGKSTLLRLIMGDLQADAGRVHYETQTTDKCIGASRRGVALVTQFPKLFTASLKDNITLFDPSVNEERLLMAMRMSLADGFVDDLPQGIESIVGPNGIRLSGGQMQSVAIARAFYANTKVILLDEPTASFDLQREQVFLERLRANLSERLVIVTSHRQQPISAADYLVDLGQTPKSHGVQADD